MTETVALQPDDVGVIVRVMLTHGRELDGRTWDEYPEAA